MEAAPRKYIVASDKFQYEMDKVYLTEVWCVVLEEYGRIRPHLYFAPRMGANSPVGFLAQLSVIFAEAKYYLSPMSLPELEKMSGYVGRKKLTTVFGQQSTLNKILDALDTTIAKRKEENKDNQSKTWANTWAVYQGFADAQSIFTERHICHWILNDSDKFLESFTFSKIMSNL